MDRPRNPTPAAPDSRRRQWIRVGALVLTVAGVSVAYVRTTRHPAASDALAAAVAASPYLNVRPGVAYVGDASCASCHPIQADSYRHHPMGRSLVPVTQIEVERYERAAHNPFDALDSQFRFNVERRPDGVTHKAEQLDPNGKPVLAKEDRVAFAIGSGARGRSYLFDRDGYLFQSPVSWYTQRQRWDLSPKFRRIYPPDRPIEPECLYCHSNRYDHVAGTRNRYRAPIFAGHTIGCERCHGPGELHGARYARGDAPAGPDDTIVNPRRLPPALREAVCQQCHLEGEKRVERRGRDPQDFRPGLPFHLFWSVFVAGPGFEDNARAVSHVQQMYASRCFQASDGAMGCISCHDAHRLPAAEDRVAYYRRQCLGCHEKRSCSLPAPARQRVRDDCVTCHMPRQQTTNVAHTAVTDHRVLRDPARSGPVTAEPRALQPGEIPLVHFFATELAADKVGADRDLGVALAFLGNQSAAARVHLARAALPLLEPAVRAAPDDYLAWEAEVNVLAQLGRADEAEAAAEAALRAAPDRELTLDLAARLARSRGRDEQAIAYLRRAVALNPTIADDRLRLAELLGHKKDWPAAWAEAEAALALNPFSEKARRQYITCCLRTNRKAQAEKELTRLLALNPDNAREYRFWYEEQVRGGE